MRHRWHEALDRAARLLIKQGTYIQAIPMLLDLNEPHEAARVIVQMIEPMMDLGQWDLLAGWLKRLPDPVHNEWPWLVYTAGELAAARGQNRAARKIFASATRRFQEHRDTKGACQSLLTESCLSAWQKNFPRAREYALRARALAEDSQLTWYQGWANWQLGCLNISAGQIAEAHACFNSARRQAEISGDRQMASFIDQAVQLVQTQQEQRQKKAQQVLAYYQADQAEHDASLRMRLLLENPAAQAGDLRGMYGWPQTPLFLKLPPRPKPIPFSLGQSACSVCCAASCSPPIPCRSFRSPERSGRSPHRL